MGNFRGVTVQGGGLFRDNCMGGKSSGGNKSLRGVVVQEELFKGNCPGGISWRAQLFGGQ